MSISNIMGRTAILAAVLWSGGIGAASGSLLYTSVQAPYQVNVPGLGYQATSTTEFGDLVHFTGTDRSLSSITVLMSNWAKYSDWSASYGLAGYAVPITMSLYNVLNPLSGPSVGSLIASRTITPTIVWRPEPNPTCGSGFLGWDNRCYSGLAQAIVFDFTGVWVPDDVIYGLSFNTENYGPTPTGVAGPYNSLNVGLVTTPPIVGTDLDPNVVFWNTAHAGFLTSGIAGVFGPDSAWAPYSPAISIEAIPEPASLALFGMAALGLLTGHRACRRRQA
ncbi:MAG: PEP-CTERM sorting domain-containing protein [Acetobacteraceae bacterium]